MNQEKKKKQTDRIMLLVKKIIMKDGSTQQGIGHATVTHAVVVIFLEFFAWGLLTTPMLTVLHETFPQHTFLMNGLIQGVKGFLSFMSAPLIGALSDVWGRKSFLLVTVFFTCAPIPLMRISPWWYFAMISVSGIFSVTFSVIFAYVADITEHHERSTAYGLVIGFSSVTIAEFIAVVGILSIIAQDDVGSWSDCSNVQYYIPCSVVQGMVTGIRGLCNGLGPALYGFIFFLFHVELSELGTIETTQDPNKLKRTEKQGKLLLNIKRQLHQASHALYVDVYVQHASDSSST
ncbi:Hippocampus abundant transcript 1 protein [Acipenser ruthenus]|uniref:Hippocampus abundant transcript 1 protein n=1 Tax=Acipenser ruthenus TaxID=7906 RepID=A0A444V1P0_ACIRT|nr:Hippocampus abundant transcript 1 protein [Acipenser ruthenus]